MIELEQAKRILQLTLAEYSAIRSVYYSEIYAAITGYLQSDDGIRSYKSRFKTAMRQAFSQAAETGWLDGGGELPLSDKANNYALSMVSAELGHIDILFENLKDLRKEEQDTISDYASAAATQHAEGYCQTLDGLYSEIKVMAAGKSMLTLVGVDGRISCTTCRSLKGQRHQAAWWVRRGLVPRPGNANYECGCYRCQHVLVNDGGFLFTL